MASQRRTRFSYCILHLSSKLHTSPYIHHHHNIHHLTYMPHLISHILHINQNLIIYNFTHKSLLSCSQIPTLLQKRLSLFTGLDYWTGILDRTTGLEFFPFLDKLSIWFLKIFDTWRSQFFLKQS